MRYLGAVRGTVRIAVGGRRVPRCHVPGRARSWPRAWPPPTSTRRCGTRPRPFDITKERDARSQMTFGSGIHFCLGASLARAELQEALPLLARRMPDLDARRPHRVEAADRRHLGPVPACRCGSPPGTDGGSGLPPSSFPLRAWVGDTRLRRCRSCRSSPGTPAGRRCGSPGPPPPCLAPRPPPAAPRPRRSAPRSPPPRRGGPGGTCRPQDSRPRCGRRSRPPRHTSGSRRRTRSRRGTRRRGRSATSPSHPRTRLGGSPVNGPTEPPAHVGVEDDTDELAIVRRAFSAVTERRQPRVVHEVDVGSRSARSPVPSSSRGLPRARWPAGDAHVWPASVDDVNITCSLFVPSRPSTHVITIALVASDPVGAPLAMSTDGAGPRSSTRPADAVVDAATDRGLDVVAEVERRLDVARP